MTRAEIDAFFPFVPGLVPAYGAVEYAVPTRRWVADTFYPFLKERLWSDNVSKWTFAWECRDFASLARILAVECWANTPGAAHSGTDGLAFGEIWFIPDPAKPMEGHAQNAIITDHGLDILEPQTGLLCPATLQRLSSVYYRRF